MNSIIRRFYESLIPLRYYFVGEYSPLELNAAYSTGVETIGPESQTDFIPDDCSSRFYSHYGAESARRNTNLYRDGKTKGKNRKETRPIRHEKLMSILRSSKSRSR